MDQHDESDTNSGSAVLLLVANGRNRELLADQLSEVYEVHTGADALNDADFDLCLLDNQSFSRYSDRLRKINTRSAPTFRPILLLTGKQSPDELPQKVWDVADEVIQRPVSKAELDARVNNLLQRRRLSVELTREKEQSERRFESLFESTPDPVVVVRPDGTVTEVNDAFSRIFRVAPKEVRNRQITNLEFTPTESVKRVLLRIADERPSSTTVQWEYDADDHLVMELNTDVITGLGEATERIGIFRDVTERTKRAEELKRQNERLEEFANTIAHDLRNPLNVARGRLEIAQKTGDEEQFTAVDQAHERMEQMIEELLSLAIQGQAILEPDSLRLKATVEKAWSHIESPDATLEVDISSSVVITADEGRLSELFENLFRNAIEHGGSKVTVRVGLLPDSAGLYVGDDGPGISVEKRNEVFEAGYSDALDGTGFGLSIVQQIVNGHEWEITITENDVGGARFEITNVQLVSCES